MTGSDRGGGRPPQLHIWDAAAREFDIGVLSESDGDWELVVVAERAERDLYRGRISFRRDDTRLDTDAILVEETEEALLQRAVELPASTLKQLLHFLRSD
jgi:hypothetical protein